MIKHMWSRVKDRDRLAYMMVIAFGVSLLGISITFQLGYAIGEESLAVRAIEMAISLGLIALGIERLKDRRKGLRMKHRLYWTWNDRPVPASIIVDECAEAVNMIEEQELMEAYLERTRPEVELMTKLMEAFNKINRPDSLTDRSVGEEEES